MFTNYQNIVFHIKYCIDRLNYGYFFYKVLKNKFIKLPKVYHRHFQLLDTVRIIK